MNTQSSGSRAVSYPRVPRSLALATVSAVFGIAVGASAVVGWQELGGGHGEPAVSAPPAGNAAAPAIPPGLGDTQDSVQPGFRDLPVFAGKHGHVDSDPAVRFEFTDEPVSTRSPIYPASREGRRGWVFPD